MYNTGIPCRTKHTHMNQDFDWIKIGVECRWNDTAINDYAPEDRQVALERVFTVFAIAFEDEDNPVIEPDTEIYIDDGFTFAEVNASELVPVK